MGLGNGGSTGMLRRLALLPIALVLLVGAGVTANAGVDPTALCKERKAKAAGKMADGLLEAFARNLRRPDPGRLQSNVSATRSALTKGFTRAEFTSGGTSKGCQTVGDAATIAGTMEAYVEDVLAEIGASTTTSSTSTTTSTTM